MECYQASIAELSDSQNITQHKLDQAERQLRDSQTVRESQNQLREIIGYNQRRASNLELEASTAVQLFLVPSAEPLPCQIYDASRTAVEWDGLFYIRDKASQESL